jgi:HEAT repeat protein/energy-coupling factor transporter ATP-binding protein EcfA2
MDIAEELKDIGGRIGCDVHTDADLQRLQEIIETIETHSVVLNEDANGASIIAGDGCAIVYIPAQGDGFQAGDFKYPIGAEVLRSLLESILLPINPSLDGDAHRASILAGKGVIINSLEVKGDAPGGNIAEELKDILGRIGCGNHNGADLQRLQEIIVAIGTHSVAVNSMVASGTGAVQIGKDANNAIINTGDGNINIVFKGDGFQTGDGTYSNGAEVLRSLLESIAPPKVKIDWQKGSRTWLDKKLELTTNPLTDINDKAKDIYVPLGLLEREKKHSKQSQANTPERGAELERQGATDRSTSTTDREPQMEITKRFEHHEFLDEVFRKEQSPKSQGKRIAIIGEPGAGKTTLLQQIADWIKGTFPSAIVIWVSLANLEQKDLETYIEMVWLKFVVREADLADVSTAMKESFITQIKQGQVWLLLDGLDEMQQRNPLNVIQRQIDEGAWLEKMRIVMTCRLNLWDGDRNGLKTFDTYRTLEFAYPEQVEMFIEQWFKTRGAGAIDRGKKLCKVLKKAGNERIRALMKNPLRLSLMCFNWFSTPSNEEELPNTQAELYQRFVNLIYLWNKEKFPAEEQRDNLNQKLAKLSRAAIDGDARGRLRLSEVLVKQYLDINDISLAQQLGWLNQVDRDAKFDPIYAFFHPTFEEYFAALGIDDERFFLTLVPKNPLDKSASYRLFEPQWRQVFLLWLGRGDLEPARKEALIQTLMNFKDRCGDFYTDRAFLLAAVGIAEFKDCKQADEIVHKLVQWKFPSPDQFPSLARRFKNHGREAARGEWATNILSRTDSQRVIESISRVLETTKDNDTRWNAAEILGEIGNETAIQALIKVIETTQNDNIRERAIEILDKIDPGNETAIQALVKVIETTQNDNTRKNAAEILGKIGTIKALVGVLGTTQDESTRRSVAVNLGKIDPGNETAIEALVGVLGTTQDESTCKSASESLGEIGIGNETAIKALVEVLGTTPYGSTRQSAAASLGKIGTIEALVEVLGTTPYESIRRSTAASLGKIGTGNETAIKALVGMLGTTQDESTRRSVAANLGKIGTSNETAIKALVGVLGTTPYESTRQSAAASLGKIDPGNETAIKALVGVLGTTPYESTRRSVAESLVEIDPGNETAIKALVGVLGTTQHESTRQSAAASLGKIDPGNETAIEVLVGVLGTTQDEYTRRSVAESLGEIDPDKIGTIKALVGVLETTQDEYTRRSVAESLGEIDPGNQTAIKALVGVLETTQDESTRHRAAASLGKIDPGNETAIEALVGVLETTQNEYTRRSVAESLGEIDPGNQTAIKALVKVLETTQDDSTRWRVAKSLGKIGMGNETVIEALVRVLETNPNDFEVRSCVLNFDPGHETAIEALIRVLETTQDEYTRQRAAASLGKIDPGNQTAIKALVRVLKTTQDEYTRQRAAASLGKIDPGNQTAIKALVKVLETNLNNFNNFNNFTKRAAASLVEIGSHETAIEALVKVLETTQNGYTRESSAAILGEIVTGNQTAIKILVRSLRSNSMPKEGYILMMKCAESLSYKEFYRAFHALP